MSIRVHRAPDGRKWEVINPETLQVYGQFGTEHEAREAASDVELRRVEEETRDRNRVSRTVGVR